jgi:hypothetical protein
MCCAHRSGLNYFAHGKPITRAKVVVARQAAIPLERLERKHMRLGEIGNMDEITNAGGVGRVVIKLRKS